MFMDFNISLTLKSVSTVVPPRSKDARFPNYVHHEELIESLRITLQEALEFNRQDAISAASENYREEKIAV